MFSSLIFINPTSESERNKESNDSYKSHPQQRLKIGLWAQNSTHIKWNGYVGCVIRQTQHPLVKSILSSMESLVIFSFCNFFKRKIKIFWIGQFFWNRPVRPVHRLNHRFERFNSGSISIRSKWPDRTGMVTGRRLDQSDRPVRSGF